MLESAIRACILADKIPYIEGPPGWGKSAMCKAMAKEFKAKLFLVFLAQRAGNEIHGIPVVRREPLMLNGKEFQIVEQAPPRFAVEAAGEPINALIFLDELNQLSPADFGQVMSIFTERLVGDVKLPRERIALLGAGNPPEMSAGGWRMPLPARRRIVKLQMELNAGAFCDPGAFPSNWGFELPELVKFGKKLDQAERFRMRTLLAAWVHANADVFNLPKDLSKMYDGWASPAVVEDVADILVSIKQNVIEDQAGEVRHALLTGAMGKIHADSLMLFMDNMDVPDAREVLDDPKPFMSLGTIPEPDKLYYFLMSLAEEQRFRTEATRETDKKAVLTKAQNSWYNALEVVSYLNKKGAPKDLLVMLVGNLVSAGVKPKAVQPPKVVGEFAALTATMRASGVSFASLSAAE